MIKKRATVLLCSLALNSFIFSTAVRANELQTNENLSVETVVAQQVTASNEETTDKLATTTNSNALPLGEISKKLISEGVLLERGVVNGVDFNIVSFEKNGPYVIRRGIMNEKTFTRETLQEEGRKRNTPVLFNGAFWTYGTLDKEWSQREIKAGKKGFLYSDGENNIKAGVHGLTSLSEIFEHTGLNGWEAGAFGTIVEDGKITNRWTPSDPNVRTARTMYVETVDGVIKIIQVYGHSSTKNGINHDEMIKFLENIGIENIKLAFNLDGGGSNRMYTKDLNNEELLSGSFVDNRGFSDYFYLGLRGTGQNEAWEHIDKTKQDNNQSETVTAKKYFDAKNAGLTKIPGTIYELNNSVENTEVVDGKLVRTYVYLRETKADSFTNINSTQVVVFRAEGDGEPKLWKETKMLGRDPSIIKEGDYYYIAVTRHSRANKQDFMIYKTKDFTHFEEMPINAGVINEKTPHVWAPDFFRTKEGRVGVIFSANDKGEEVDILGHTILNHSPYITMVDLATGKANNTQRVELNDGNKIDGHIFLKDNKYHMIIKDEYRKELELWTSDTLSNWQKVYDVIPNTGSGIEGAFVEPVGDGYRITYDRHYAFRKNDPLYINYVETKDFVTFSNEKPANLGENLRHGSVFVEGLDVPFETSYEDDPTLPVGEERVKTEGVVGKKNSDGVVTKQPVTKVIAKGTGANEVIPFETRFEDDDTLDEDKEIVLNPGANGERRVDGTVIKEPVPRVVKRGTRKQGTRKQGPRKQDVKLEDENKTPNQTLDVKSDNNSTQETVTIKPKTQVETRKETKTQEKTAQKLPSTGATTSLLGLIGLPLLGLGLKHRKK